ncbi:MAG: flagellar basal body P-ring protein FlgI [Burkholderiales bacterium]|nr:flagellar basal body P-ring protein FlgI [Burkholderiales bacterium]
MATAPTRLADEALAADRAERRLRRIVWFAFFLASAALWWPAEAARIKEVASVAGVRPNQLTGYGLVVGLDGSGDQVMAAPFTSQSLRSMLQQMGVNVPPGMPLQLKNIAAVLVTAVLPPYAQPGQPVDVTVSSIGNAKSLRGGTLVATPLKGVDGQIYALAQGNVVIGGAGAAANGSKVQINQLLSGRVPAGATVERGVPSPALDGDALQLALHATDHQTANAVAQAINRAKGEGTAVAIDGRLVRVALPPGAGQRVAFVADIENLAVEPGRPAAKVILNARTGSVVLNEAVTLGPCAVAHGNLAVTISTTPTVSQPNALAAGRTVVTAESDISITTGQKAMIEMPAGVKLADVVKALNAMGATPQDLLVILQAMKSAGALHAEIEVI